MKDDADDPAFAFAVAAVVRRGDPEWTTADQAGLDRWRRADPRHAQALERAEALWSRFEIVAPAWEQVERRQGGLTRRAALLGLGGIGAAVLGGRALTRPGLFADYRTAASERRLLTLADGSSVDLGTLSALSLGRGPREVALDQGEAFFRVAPGAEPFFVRALGGRVGVPPATPAAFALRAVDRAGLLAAAEGQVVLRLPGQPPLTLAPGQETRFSRQGAGAPAVSAPGSVASWRENRLVFADVPLAEVVAELGRYRPGRVMTDPRVGAMRVTAVFDTTDIAGAFDSLARNLPLRVIDAGLALLVVAG